MEIQPELLIQEVVFSPLTPREEARSIDALLGKLLWETKPETSGLSLTSVDADGGRFLDEAVEESMERHGFTDEEQLPALLANL